MVSKRQLPISFVGKTSKNYKKCNLAAFLNVEIMQDHKMLNYIKAVLANMPNDWLNLTTHRLDIYEEKLAKTQFLEQFEKLFLENNAETSILNQLPTAYDYIRLGHPLSCVLEWGIAQLYHLNSENIISFSSISAPIFAVLRKNHLAHKNTQILYNTELPGFFNAELLKRVYGYKFDLKQVDKLEDIANAKYNETTILLVNQADIWHFEPRAGIDFIINYQREIGSILLVNGQQNESYISEIQHVRRRETIAMTPANCLLALQALVAQASIEKALNDTENSKRAVLDAIATITGAATKPVVGSSGLSVQYAIMMGLIDHAQNNHAGKAIKFIVPPNCYGGTNDQARRVAACNEQVEVLDLLVDAGHDMVQSIDNILAKIALEDAVPYIIAEIPTNPRVEVPNLQKLREVLSKPRLTPIGTNAVDPVFILDQTFCPNVHFLGENDILSNVRTISYASGSKFPSGGKCTSGYCVGNKKTEDLMEKIALHLSLCDNEATPLQYEILANQLPSMNQRIITAYHNTREFVHYIQEVLPAAKINFVSDALANQGFTPSVFSLDLPTKGNSHEEREAYKRELNLTLINLMITKIPNESKYCVSYGQLKGCYWTIPATSTQGTTKEGDKDYIVRASLSAKMDLELHKKVFLDFVNSL